MSNSRFELSHPLLCPLVVQNIFGNLDLEDLKMCRLVCEGWDAISLLQFKSATMKPMVRVCLTDEKRLQEFLDMKTGLSEFQHFKVTFSMESESILSQFMNQFKNQIKDVTFVLGKNVGDINFNLADKFLPFLATNSSNWESFGIEINGESSKDTPTQPLESYEVNWSQLENLSIKKVSDCPIFISILEKATELKKLVVLDGPVYSTYQPLLQNLISTLIEFELTGCSRRDERYTGVNDRIPSFTQLKRLKIGKLIWGNYMTIPSLPELFELSINHIMWIRFEELAVFSKLTCLDYSEGFISEQEFKKYPDRFPNLKKLHVRCANNVMMVDIWKYCKTIEELRAECQNVTDAGIIGFHYIFSVTNQNNPRMEVVNWSEIYSRSKQFDPDRALRLSSIGIQSLPELKNVTITASKISNVSIIFGLLKCKSLRSIQLVSPSPYLTKDILKWMADELNLMHLSIDVASFNHDWGSSEEAIYFRKAHPHCQLTFPYYPAYTTLLDLPSITRL